MVRRLIKIYSIFVKISTYFLLLALLLTGCSINEQQQPLPVLSVTGDGNTKIPVLQGITNSDVINQKLKEYFERINSRLAGSFPKNAYTCIGFDFVKTSDEFNLAFYIYQTKNNKRYVYNFQPIRIYPDGQCLFPEMPKEGSLESEKFISSLMYLSTKGINVDIYRFGTNLYEKQMSALIIDCYETLSGRTVSIPEQGKNSNINELYLKARLTETTSLNQHDFLNDTYPVDAQRLLYEISKISEKIERDVYGRYDEPAKISEILNNAKLYAGIMTIASDDAVSWTNLIERISFSFDEPEERITRKDIAEALISISRDVTVGAEYYNQNILTDTDDIYAERAVASSIMDFFPCYSFFSPDYAPCIHQTFDIARVFVNGLYSAWCDKNNQNTGFLTYDNAVVAVAEWLSSYDARQKPEYTVYEIDNGKDYDWYYTQLDQSEYQYTNCMPAMTCMAVKWKNVSAFITPDQLRQKFPDIKSGWWMEQVKACLDEYGIAYETKKINLETIITDLDSGKIILTQMTEGNPSLEGHCMVIYGYIKINESIIFLINDPDNRGGTTVFGESGGKAAKLCANYSLWIMQRLTDEYLAIIAD